MFKRFARETWRTWFWGLFAGGILVNLLGLYSPILEPDGALYASIAKTMVQKNDWVNLYAHNKDWLDKPHFPFWVTALSYSIFGINSIAYKLPALLFWALGGWYTFKIARRWYSVETAQIAILIYLTALHLVISNNDVRAEPYLTGLLAGGVYHWLAASSPVGSHRSGKSRPVTGHLTLGAAFMAAAIMTKGIFILIPVGAGLLLHWGLNGNLKNELAQVKWWATGLLVALLITPELYSLYLQFDLHPEKTVFDRTGVSGLRFFFWDSQFGRFMNTGPIKGKGDPFFFVHTLLWAFLPWSILLYTSLGSKFRSLFRRERGEWMLFGVSMMSFLLFSASRFQLPHYMNIVFPFFSVLTAAWLLEVRSSRILPRVFGKIQWAIALILFVGCVGLWALMYQTNFRPLVYAAAFLIGWILFWIRAKKLGFEPVQKLVISTSLAAISLYGFLNLYFYPALLEYQSGNKAAEWLNTNAAGKTVYTINPWSYSLDFYSDGPTRYTTREEAVASSRDSVVLVYTSREQVDTLRGGGHQVAVLDSFAHYHISKLKIGFLMPDKRAKYLQYRYLIELKK